MNERPPPAARGVARLLLLGACVGWTATGLASLAGAVPEPATPSAQSDARTAVSDAKLRQFALAAANVQAIQQEYAVEAQALKNETEARIMDSVEQSGLTVEEFQRIFQQVEADPGLAKRLDELTKP